MSLLRIFRPDEDTPLPAPVIDVAPVSEVTPGDTSTDDEPVLLNFEEWSQRLRPQAATLNRARQIHSNCQCPSCQSALVVPLTLNDGRKDRSGEDVPGSATLVGFRCDVCLSEWPA